MREIWRLLKARFAEEPLSGEGARLHGGRWNSPGTTVVYCSGSVALAALELLVHLHEPVAIRGFVLVRLTVPDAPTLVSEPTLLPDDWRATPPSPATQHIGDEWVRKAGSLLLRVPSVIVALEYNYLLNPGHPDARRVRVDAPRPFSFDPRLLRPRASS